MKTFKELFDRAESLLSFRVQGAILDFTEEVYVRMKSLGVTKAELARKLGVKPPYVTRVLEGRTNFTLGSMVKIARALDADIRIHLQPDGATSEWKDVVDGKTSLEAQPRMIPANLEDFVFSQPRTIHPEMASSRSPEARNASNEQLALTA